jgi:hypothetical protein
MIPTVRRGAWHPRNTAAAAATGLALVTGVAAHGYSLKPYKWNGSEASYFVNPANRDVPESAAEAAVRAGADAWSTQSNASFAWVYAGRTTASTVSANGKSEVFFHNESSGNTIATTYWWTDASGNLVEADIKFYVLLSRTCLEHRRAVGLHQCRLARHDCCGPAGERPWDADEPEPLGRGHRAQRRH